MWLSFLVGVSWIAFWIYWFAVARGTGFSLSAAVNRRLRASWLLVVVLAFIVINRHWNLGQMTFHHQLVLRALGAVLFYVGIGLAVWARRHLGASWGMPMTVRQKPTLITTGPYHRIRHPIYTGLILMTLGSGLILSRVWLFIFAASTIYCIFSALQEEKMLAKQLPKEYPAYRRRSKMLIPYLF